MHAPTEMSPAQSRKQRAKPSRAKRFALWALFFIVWAGLVGGGMYSSYIYIEQVKADLIAEVNARNEQQLEALKEDYEKQISILKEDIASSFSKIEAEVTSLNELLIFAKDSADKDFDSSNQLYTQLNRLEEQLNQLKQNMELLK